MNTNTHWWIDWIAVHLSVERSAPIYDIQPSIIAYISLSLSCLITSYYPTIILYKHQYTSIMARRPIRPGRDSSMSNHSIRSTKDTLLLFISILAISTFFMNNGGSESSYLRRKLSLPKPENTTIVNQYIKSYLGGLYPAVDMDMMPLYLRNTYDDRSSSGEGGADLVFFWHIPKVCLWESFICPRILVFQYCRHSLPHT